MAVRIKRLSAPPEVSHRLRELGFCEDQQIRLLSHQANVICQVCNVRLGISAQFEAIFDIKAADFVPKPDPFTYEMMVRRHWIDPKRAVMVEDLPKNLLPAHRMGMTTVLVRTHEEWAQAGADGDHVHHVTYDLVTWLEAAGASAAKG